MNDYEPNSALLDLCKEWGLHPDEARPRAQTWLHERKNWEEEVAHLREYQGKLEKANNRMRVLMRAVLLFHQVGPWTDSCQLDWDCMTGNAPVTTKALCDMIRDILY